MFQVIFKVLQFIFKVFQFIFKVFQVCAFWILLWCFYTNLSSSFQYLFRFIIAFLFLSTIFRNIIKENYDQLSLKERILNGVYFLIKNLRKSEMGGMDKYFAEYPIVKEAKSHLGLFDYKTTEIIYKLDQGIVEKNSVLLRTLDFNYIDDCLQDIKKQKSLGYFLIDQILIELIVQLPLSIFYRVYLFFRKITFGKRSKK